MDVVSIVVLAAFLLITYKVLTKNLLVFKKRGIEFEQPTLFFGNMLNCFLGNESEQAAFKYLYDKFDREKLFGMFMMTRPVFVVKDVDLIREMTIKHFDTFASDGDHAKESFRDINQNSSSLSLSVTKLLQSCLECAAELISQLESDRSCAIVNIKEIFEKIVVDSISKSLGVNQERINEVHEKLKLIETDLLSFKSSIKALINSIAPEMFQKKLLSREVCKILNELSGSYEAAATENNARLKIQLEAFVCGGFRAIVRLLQACFFELAKNPEVQNALHQEIDAVNHKLAALELAKTFNSMDLLDAVIKETLRKHPPVTFSSRICTGDCIVTTKDGEQLKFVKGDVIHIPIKLIQNDPQNFSNPDAFQPSRFAFEKSKRHWLPFGPTSCPGADLVITLAKTFVFSLLREFSVELTETVKEFDENRISLKFVPRR